MRRNLRANRNRRRRRYRFRFGGKLKTDTPAEPVTSHHDTGHEPDSGLEASPFLLAHQGSPPERRSEAVVTRCGEGPCYSLRRAAMGSTRVARRAGI
jgi:hypothetical protein